MACPHCGSAQTKTRRDERFELDGIAADVEVQALTCTRCGRVDGELPRERMNIAFARLISRVGTGSGVAFRLFRGCLNLKATHLGALLNVRPETISRWENGQGAVDRASWLLLGAMVEDQLEERTRTRDRLQAAASPRIPKGVVKLTSDGMEMAASVSSRALAPTGRPRQRKRPPKRSPRKVRAK